MAKETFYMALLSWAGSGATPNKSFSKSPRPRWKGFFMLNIMADQINALKGVLSGGTVSFHAIFAKAFRSIPAGVFLSQGYFWQENAKYRDKDKYKTVEGKTFFSMTAKEWFEETSLTQEQQSGVRKILKKHKVLIEWLTDNPARLFFHIDLEALVSVINQYSESGVSVSVDNRNKNMFKTKTSLGKKRKQDSVKNLTSYNEESIESLESVGEAKHAPAPEYSTSKEEKESPKVAQKGSFEVTAIASPTDLPGVTLVESVPKRIEAWEHPNPASPKELKGVLLRYADQDPDNWRDNVLESGRATNLPLEKIDECLTDFCAWQFKTDFTKAKLSQYTAAFSLWLKRQKGYDAQVGNQSQVRNGNGQKANINNLGSNPERYAETPLF